MINWKNVKDVFNVENLEQNLAKMKVKLEVGAFVALLLVVSANCVRVIENDIENTTKLESAIETEDLQESSEPQTTLKPTESSEELEPRNIESDYNHVTTSSTTTTTTQTISQTLINAKHEAHKEVTERMLKDLV